MYIYIVDCCLPTQYGTMKFIHLLDPIQNMFSVYVQQDDDESKKTNKRKWSQCQFSFNVMPKRYITERILSCLDATFYDDMSIPNDIEMNTSHNYNARAGLTMKWRNPQKSTAQ